MKASQANPEPFVLCLLAAIFFTTCWSWKQGCWKGRSAGRPCVQCFAPCGLRKKTKEKLWFVFPELSRKDVRHVILHKTNKVFFWILLNCYRSIYSQKENIELCYFCYTKESRRTVITVRITGSKRQNRRW